MVCRNAQVRSRLLYAPSGALVVDAVRLRVGPGSAWQAPLSPVTPNVWAMGGIGYSLEVSGNGDRTAMGKAFWESALDWIYPELGLTPADELDYYLDDTVDWTTDDNSVTWWFANPGGCCSRSSKAWLHWFQLAIAAGWDEYSRIAAERYGLTIESERLDLAELLRSGDLRLVRLRGNIWIADERGLAGDDAHIPATELTESERALHAEALTRCLCPICELLRWYQEEFAGS